SGLPQPVGRKGCRLPLLTAGTAITTNTVSAMILMATSTAFTRALLDVPITSRPVTATPIRNANRLNPPPSVGPTCSQCGSDNAPGLTSPNTPLLSNPFT